MKQIQPITIWSQGVEKEAGYIKLYCHDNLVDHAMFDYTLLSNVNEVLSQGNITMSGPDYINWGISEDINLSAYIWVTERLNLTLI